MKHFVIGLILTIVAGAVVSGIFIGGIAIGKNQATTTATINRAFTPPTGASFTGNPSGFAGRGTIGTVASIDGNTITLTTMQGTTETVVTGENTIVRKTVTGALSDVKTGDTVSVTGTTETGGSITAASISITTADSLPTGQMQRPPMTTTVTTAQ